MNVRSWESAYQVARACWIYPWPFDPSESTRPFTHQSTSRAKTAGIFRRHKARSAAKRLGVGAILRRNINVIGKDRREKDWWVERIRNWNGNRFVDIKR